MKKEKFFLISVIVGIIILILVGVIILKNINDKNSLQNLDVKAVSALNLKTGCKTISAKDFEGVDEYSFDGGENWQKSNYSIVCSNGKISVLARDINKKIIGKGSINIVDLVIGYPKIKIDFTKKVNSLSDKDLLNGVTATSNGKDITKDLIIENKTFVEDGVIVKYSVTDSNGNKTSVDRKINRIQNAREVIDFEKTSYTCAVGEKIETIIELKTNSDTMMNISTYSSSNDKVATIVKNSKVTLKTPNAVAVVIECKSVGKTDLNAKTSNGLEVTVPVTVTEKNSVNNESIVFEKESYTCVVGDKIETTIEVKTNSDKMISVSSYNSSNDKVATIVKNSKVTLKTPNAVAVVIECKTAGKTNMTAKSSSGLQVTVPVTVSEKTVEPSKDTSTNDAIGFKQERYICAVGKKIATTIHTITSSGSVLNVSSYASSDDNIATIYKDPNTIIRTPSIVAVVIECKSVGQVNMVAKASNGIEVTVPVVVTENGLEPGEHLAFEKESYTCSKGKKIFTTISASSQKDLMANVSSYTSSDETIATITEDPNKIIRTPGIVAVVIECKKTGTVTLEAKSSTGSVISVKLVVK